MVSRKLDASLGGIRGGEAATLVGGTAALLMILATLAAHGPRRMLDISAEHITNGFVFAFKAMGSVLPIAAQILGVAAGKAPNLLFELIQAYRS